MTAKVHKPKLKFRPVVATCGTILHGISKWVDYHLQKLMHLIPTYYIRDCFEAKAEMEQLGQLPEGTCLFTMDANRMDATSMYTNIDTDHGLHILEQFLEMHKDETVQFSSVFITTN